MMVDPDLAGQIVAQLLIVLVVVGIPLFAIFGKIGRTRLWLLLLIVPALGPLFLLWFVAFAKWPNRKTGNTVEEARQ